MRRDLLSNVGMDPLTGISKPTRNRKVTGRVREKWTEEKEGGEDRQVGKDGKTAKEGKGPDSNLNYT